MSTIELLESVIKVFYYELVQLYFLFHQCLETKVSAPFLPTIKQPVDSKVSSRYIKNRAGTCQGIGPGKIFK